MQRVYRLDMNNYKENTTYEQCEYAPTKKHYFLNSWGSLRNGGYCGVCKYCNTTTITPYLIREVIQNKSADISPELLDVFYKVCKS
jgi:hypothetical protein